MNAIQFNALAIVFLIGILPFAVAFITNAGGSSDGEYQDSINHQLIYHPHNNQWLNNGGTNFTNQYILAGDPEANRTYVEDGAFPTGGWFLLLPAYSYPGVTPMNSFYLDDTHGKVTTGYIGSSGNGPFTLLLNSKFWNAIDSNETIDKFRFSFIDTDTTYNCASTVFENLTFEADMTWIQGNDTLSFNNFEFSKSTKYQFNILDPQHGYVEVCVVGFDIEFDLTGFESIQLYDFIQGDWFNAQLILNLDNFQRTDDNLPFTTEALPFAGDGRFNLGVEHQSTDPIQTNFIIKSGTLFLSIVTFALAIASTPYWDPFRNFFKGMIQ